MTEEKKFYILGKVFHQDDTNPIELLGEANDTNQASERISDLMNRTFSPKEIFVIEGVKREIYIKEVSMK